MRDKTMKKHLISFMLALILLTACEQEDIVRAPEVESELQTYLDRFMAEGEARQFEPVLDVQLLDLRFGSLEEAVRGQCQLFSDGRRAIIIQESYWENANEWAREFLVFHELGHCLLDRRHLETADANGNCISIMHSGEGGCRNLYGPTTRTEYLNELFGQ